MPSQFARHWTLERSVTFLNHGSFGATPRPVLDAQTKWRERMEREPVAFFVRELEPAMDDARALLGAFIGADPDDLAFVPNATTGVNTVLRSLDLRPGDEILTTDHAYNAVRNALVAAAEPAAARITVAALPFPGATPGDVIELVLGAVTPRTRLAVIDHVTSTTAMVLPVAEIVRALAERGIDTLVDAAHAPGMLDLDVDAIGAAYYTGNGHKWLSAPKGAGFLHVRRDLHARVRPLAISHGANSPRTDRSRFRLEHDWTGTADPSAFLSIPAAIEFGAGLLEGGWPALRARNHELALRGRDLVCSALGVVAPVPDAMLASMATIALPSSRSSAYVDDGISDDALHAALEAQGIQAMVAPWPMRPDGGAWRRVIRVSAAPYVAIEDFERLADAIPAAVAALAD
jgi:isopenicillin-N epimerase